MDKQNSIKHDSIKHDSIKHDSPHESVKLITCIINSEAISKTSEKELLQTLYDEKKIVRANSIHCRGYAPLHETKLKNSTLPQSHFSRLIEIIVPSEEADQVFEFIFHKLNIDRPGVGVMHIKSLNYSSGFSMPETLSVTGNHTE